MARFALVKPVHPYTGIHRVHRLTGAWPTRPPLTSHAPGCRWPRVPPPAERRPPRRLLVLGHRVAAPVGQAPLGRAGWPDRLTGAPGRAAGVDPPDVVPAPAWYQSWRAPQ